MPVLTTLDGGTWIEATVYNAKYLHKVSELIMYKNQLALLSTKMYY